MRTQQFKMNLDKQKLPPKIAIGHQARVGKDTAADHIIESRPDVAIHRLRVAEKLYEVAEAVQRVLGKPVEKDPGLLQVLGEGLRQHYGRDIWIDQTDKKYKKLLEENPNAGFILVDARHENELNWATDNDFVTLKLTRERRVIDRDPNHISEIALADANFDYHIANDNTVEWLGEKLDEILVLENMKRDRDQK